MQPSRESPVEIKLPPDALFETLLDTVPQGCTFTLPDAEHALRHATSLLTILKNVILPKNESHASLLYGQNLVWLLDSLQSLSSILAVWPTSLGVGSAPVVQMALDLAEAHATFRGTEATLYHKANSVLALVCADFFQNPSRLLAEDEDGLSLRRVLCVALIHLAKATADHEPTSRLVASGLLASAQRVVSENAIIGSGTDLWVGWLATSRELCIAKGDLADCLFAGTRNGQSSLSGAQRGS